MIARCCWTRASNCRSSSLYLLGPALRALEVPDLAAAQLLAHHRHLRAHRLAELLLLLDQLDVLRVVLRADRLRALEHHVLEEVADAGDAGPLVHRADVGGPAGGDRGRVVLLVEQEAHAVREGDLADLDLRVLGGRGARGEERGGRQCCREGLQLRGCHRGSSVKPTVPPRRRAKWWAGRRGLRGAGGCGHSGVDEGRDRGRRAGRQPPRARAGAWRSTGDRLRRVAPAREALRRRAHAGCVPAAPARSAGRPAAGPPRRRVPIRLRRGAGRRRAPRPARARRRPPRARRVAAAAGDREGRAPPHRARGGGRRRGRRTHRDGRAGEPRRGRRRGWRGQPRPPDAPRTDGNGTAAHRRRLARGRRRADARALHARPRRLPVGLPAAGPRRGRHLRAARRRAHARPPRPPRCGGRALLPGPRSPRPRPPGPHDPVPRRGPGLLARDRRAAVGTRRGRGRPRRPGHGRGHPVRAPLGAAPGPQPPRGRPPGPVPGAGGRRLRPRAAARGALAAALLRAGLPDADGPLRRTQRRREARARRARARRAGIPRPRVAASARGAALPARQRTRAGAPPKPPGDERF